MKAIFHHDFHWGRKKSNIGFAAYASPNPQTFPRDFIEAAIKANCATKHPNKRKVRKT